LAFIRDIRFSYSFEERHALNSNTWDQRNAFWQGWQSLGGFLTSDPVAVANFSRNVYSPAYLFALGAANELYLSLDETPRQWQPLGITGASRPSATLTVGQNNDYFLDVFIRGEDAALYHRRYVTTYSWSRKVKRRELSQQPQHPGCV
jgi:hypothetical protein